MINLEKVSKTKRKAILVVSAEEMRQYFDAEYEKLAPQVKIDGFRQGSVPKIMAIEAIGRSKLGSLAMEHAVNLHYIKMIKETGVVPVTSPAIAVSKYPAFGDSLDNDKDQLEFSVEFDVLSDVKIGNYKKFSLEKVDKNKLEVTDEEVDKIVDYLRKQSAVLEEAKKDDVLDEGYWADIDFEGSIKHVKKEILSSVHFPMIVGETKFIPGFEEKIIGMKQGEEKSFELKIPKEAGDKEIAGKTSEFKVKINELKKLNLPKVDKDFAEKFGHTDVNKMKAAIKDNVSKEKEAREKDVTRKELVDKLVKITKVVVPPALIKQESERMKNSLLQDLGSKGVSFESYLGNLGWDEKKFTFDLEDQAEKNIIAGVAIGEVAKLENLKGENIAEAVFEYFAKAK